MDDQRVSVECRRVDLLLSSGERLSGEMFLQLQGVHFAGPQRVGEVLNAEDDFLPLRTDAGVRLVNLDQVVAVFVDAEAEFDSLLSLGAEHRLRVTPTVGEPLDVRIYVNLPGGHNRPKDFLNQPRRFLLFLLGQQVVYLAKKWIKLVED